jgi:hypothetical protein
MNTTTHRGRVLATLLTTVFLGACEFISPTETNPNAVPTASLDQLFTGIQVNSFLLAETQWSRIPALWTQQMAGTDRQMAIIDSYIIDEESADDEFNAIYTGGGLVDLREGIALAEEAGRLAYAGILRIHEAYMFGMAASIYGDIPYSEAANPEFDEPSLDDQALVYSAVQSLLDQAISDLGAGQGVGPGAVDMNFAQHGLSGRAVSGTARNHVAGWKLERHPLDIRHREQPLVPVHARQVRVHLRRGLPGSHDGYGLRSALAVLLQ